MKIPTLPISTQLPVVSFQDTLNNRSAVTTAIPTTVSVTCTNESETNVPTATYSEVIFLQINIIIFVNILIENKNEIIYILYF